MEGGVGRTSRTEMPAGGSRYPSSSENTAAVGVEVSPRAAEVRAARPGPPLGEVDGWGAP